MNEHRSLGCPAGAHCLSPSRTHHTVDTEGGPKRYARMFPELPSFQADEAFLHAIGRAGGICDCGDELDTPSSLSGVAAGWPFLGQFVAHDITADRSALQSHVDPTALRNARGPRLDLECLYGDGPMGNPFLYQRHDPAKLLLGTGGVDVPRNSEGIAIVGDPRNDTHALMTQLHVALLHAHNRFVDEARMGGVPEDEVFGTAARETRWHYQWAVLHEFLPSLVGAPLVQEILHDGPKWFRLSGEAFIPLEFADAAYRYGHSQIRHQYRLNRKSDPVSIFPDLLGFRPLSPEESVEWDLFFDADGAKTAQRAKKIDGRLAGYLIRLPAQMTRDVEADYHSLAVRDLQRGQGVGLPSGEAVARHIGARPLTVEEVGLRAAGWAGETPLWYYVLREADVATGGERLGPVGGRIVAEVMITLLDRDLTSVRHADSGYQPRRSLLELLQSAEAKTSGAR